MSLLLSALLLAGAPAADPVVGTWVNAKGSVTVRTRRCGTDLCGRVVAASPRAEEKARAAGLPRLVGTELLRDFHRDRGGWSGSLFVPDQGQTVDSELRVAGPNTLEISGCLVAGVLCKTQVWTRVS